MACARGRALTLPSPHCARSLFPVDGERLEEWVRGASDNELYCARALFRAWRAYSSLGNADRMVPMHWPLAD